MNRNGKFDKLISVKTIVTLSLTLTFIFLLVFKYPLDDFLSIYTMIIGFYFGTQTNRKKEIT